RGKAKAGCLLPWRLQDGTFLSTTDHPPRFNKPPEFRAFRFRGAPPAELARRHQEALAASDSPPVPIPDEEAAKKLIVASKRINFDWNVRRGVWVPLTAEERARLGLPVEEDA